MPPAATPPAALTCAELQRRGAARPHANTGRAAAFGPIAAMAEA